MTPTSKGFITLSCFGAIKNGAFMASDKQEAHGVAQWEIGFSGILRGTPDVQNMVDPRSGSTEGILKLGSIMRWEIKGEIIKEFGTRQVVITCSFLFIGLNVLRVSF